MVKEHALSFEAVLVSLSKTKDGVKVVLVIHPNDMTSELFTHSIGSRYQMAAVQLDDQDQPVPRKIKTDGNRAVVSAGMLCRDKTFLEWLVKKGVIFSHSEEEAIEYLHSACGIKSRADLATNAVALGRFEAIRNEFTASWGQR